MAGWVVDVVERLGEVGVGVLTLLETIFPPIPSEVILPFAGFAASRGDVNAVWAWAAATIGALVAAFALYALGALVGYERIRHLAAKRWFVVFGEKDLDRGERFFERHGGVVVLVCRCIPLLRSIVSVPAGITRMPLGKFALLTALGSGVWNAAFIYAGWELGNNWEDVEGWVGPASYAVVALLVVALGYLAWRKFHSVEAA
jgi:membrane protein DedA with SNARE-associated domain